MAIISYREYFHIHGNVHRPGQIFWDDEILAQHTGSDFASCYILYDRKK